MTKRALRSPVSRLAVAGVAALAGAVSVGAPAWADDPTMDPGSGGSLEDQAAGGSQDDPAAEPDPDLGAAPTDGSEPEPEPDEASSPGPLASSERAAAPDEVDEADELELVEPDYGFRKFRVVTRLAAGADVPAGTTTEGSVMRVVVNRADGSVAASFECATTAYDPSDPRGTSYCDGNPFGVVGEDSPLERASASRTVTEPTPDGALNFYRAAEGTSVTVSQLSVPAGLERETDTETLEPCVIETDADACGSSTDVVFEIGPPEAAEPGEPTDREDPPATSARLPDTGGADQGLLLLGSGLVAAGGAALVAGRRRPAGARH